MPPSFSGGGGGWWAREIGTICQIGVFFGETVNFWAQNGSFSAISHYVFNECCPKTVFYSIAIFVVRNRRKWPFFIWTLLARKQVSGTTPLFNGFLIGIYREEASKNMAVTSIGGRQKGKNLKKEPQSCSEKWPNTQNRHKIVAVFVVFSASSFSISLSFCSCFSLFPAVSCHLRTPTQPTK